MSVRPKVFLKRISDYIEIILFPFFHFLKIPHIFVQDKQILLYFYNKTKYLNKSFLFNGLKQLYVKKNKVIRLLMMELKDLNASRGNVMEVKALLDVLQNRDIIINFRVIMEQQLKLLGIS